MMNCELLAKAGIDVDALFHRLMGNASLVRVFIKKFTEDTTFESLKAAFAEQDMKKAELASHTLKGMCGNLSLTELYGLFTEQVNHIRHAEYQKAEAMMPDLSARYEKTIAFMHSFLEENETTGESI